MDGSSTKNNVQCGGSNLTGFTLFGAMFGGVIIGAVCVIAGAWMAFRIRRQPGESGFMKDPKGQVFSIPDEAALDFPEELEAGKEQANVLKRTERFLSSIGGGS